MTPETRLEFDAELRALVQLLGTETGRLWSDARRLEARGNAAFAAELLELSKRLDSLRRQAEQLVT